MINREIIRVRDVMQRQVEIVDGMITVSEALKALRHAGAKCLIIDKRHDDDEYGMVLIADIAKQVLARDRAADRVNVYEIMSKPVLTVAPEMDIRYCARLFERFGLSRAPVVDQGELLGIVSYTDMVLCGLCRDID
ncbi:MAG TPA: CBS domain-containing protein [Gammaproteobacteria bacterium]|nr:CBS domain-containing protein [Gammaproteobacteria bacterium]